MTDNHFKSGFIAIAGAPNVGKSTLLNRMIGEKISITSKKPQTTRNRIVGILHRPESQLVFVDTPGIHRAAGELNTRIVDVALSSFAEADLVLVVGDASHADPLSESFVFSNLTKLKQPVVLALNKIDLVPSDALAGITDNWRKAYPFDPVLPISARHGTGVEALVQAMEDRLPTGPPFFPPESLTDLPERFFVAEMIREKVFRLTGQEIPYATAVTVETFDEQERSSLVRIQATIHVERDSQKGIIIGKNGSKLKQIGEAARMEIEKMVGTRVFLKLFVRVQKNWSRDTKALRRFGY